MRMDRFMDRVVAYIMFVSNSKTISEELEKFVIGV